MHVKNYFKSKKHLCIYIYIYMFYIFKNVVYEKTNRNFLEKKKIAKNLLNFTA